MNSPCPCDHALFHTGNVKAHLDHVRAQTSTWLTVALSPTHVGSQDNEILRRVVLKYGELNRKLNNEMLADRLAAISPGGWSAVEDLRRHTRLFQWISGHALDLLDERHDTLAQAKSEVEKSLGLMHL